MNLINKYAHTMHSMPRPLRHRKSSASLYFTY